VTITVNSLCPSIDKINRSISRDKKGYGGRGSVKLNGKELGRKVFLTHLTFALTITYYRS